MRAFTELQFADVRSFQEKFGFVSLRTGYRYLDAENSAFRIAFLYEELAELQDAFSRESLSDALDALVDLAYICIGTAIFHGFTASDFNITKDDYLANREQGEPTIGSYYPSVKPRAGELPRLISQLHARQAVAAIKHSITAYELEALMQASFYNVRLALVQLYRTINNVAWHMGVTDELWLDIWKDVQRANMAKVRAQTSEESKRGSVKFDIVKPTGWIPPNNQPIIANYKERRTK